jgi:GTPase
VKKVNLDKVFFKLKIQNTYTIAGSRLAIDGRIDSGRINNDSVVLITDFLGNVLKCVAIIDIDWFDRSRYSKNVTASEGMHIGIIFEGINKEILLEGNYIIIE